MAASARPKTNDRLSRLAFAIAGTALAGVVVFSTQWGKVRAQVLRHERIVSSLGTPQDPLYPLMQQQSSGLERQIENVEAKVEANGEDIDDIKKTIDSLRTVQKESTEEIIRAIGRLEGKIEGQN